MKHEQISA